MCCITNRRKSEGSELSWSGHMIMNVSPRMNSATILAASADSCLHPQRAQSGTPMRPPQAASDLPSGRRALVEQLAGRLSARLKAPLSVGWRFRQPSSRLSAVSTFWTSVRPRRPRGGRGRGVTSTVEDGPNHDGPYCFVSLATTNPSVTRGGFGKSAAALSSTH